MVQTSRQMVVKLAKVHCTTPTVQCQMKFAWVRKENASLRNEMKEQLYIYIIYARKSEQYVSCSQNPALYITRKLNS